MAAQGDRAHERERGERRQQIVVRELAAPLRQRHRRDVAGRIDIHVTLFELPRVDIHAADRRNGVGTQGLAQVDVVVLVVPDDLVVVAVAAVETEVGVAQEVVLAEEVGSQRVPQGLPEADAIAEVVRPGLARHELRVAEHGGFGVPEGAHGVDLALPLRLLEKLDGPRSPHDGEGALLEEHVRRVGASIEGQPRGAPVDRPGLALVAPQLLAVSMQPRRDRTHEGIHGGGERGVGRILHGGRAVPDLGRERDAVVGEDAVRDPGLIDDIGLDRGQPVRLIGGGAEVHEVVELAARGVRERGGVDAVPPGIKQEKLGMIAVETSHGVPARNVVAADGVDEKR